MTSPLPEPVMLGGEPYYTARQIAEMGLPGLPQAKSGVIGYAVRHEYLCRLALLGRGGGRMYSLEALPDEAQAKVRQPARPNPTQPSPAPADSGSTQKKPNDSTYNLDANVRESHPKHHLLDCSSPNCPTRANQREK